MSAAETVSNACWVMTGGEAGHVSQAAGLAAAVGLPVERKTVRVADPWDWLPAHLCPEPLRHLTPDSDLLSPAWPRLLITCGRHSVAPAIAIRRASGGATLSVHVQNPRVPLHHFDLIAAPSHDGLSGPNVVTTQGALHGVTAEKLAAAAERFAPRFAQLPRPLVAVLIGGSNGRYRFTQAIAKEVAERLAALARGEGAGLMVTTSRRTGPDNMRVLEEGLAGLPCELWSGGEDNPYLGMLALADHIVVTADSVSMVSEACATGKPVHVIALEGGSPRFRAFHEAMERAGCTRPFNGSLETWRYDPPDDTARVAALVRARLEA